MRRADWLILTLTAALGAGSISMIVAAFLTSGSTANLLIALGVTLAVSSFGLLGQVFYTVARERQTIPKEVSTESNPSQEKAANLTDDKSTTSDTTAGSRAPEILSPIYTTSCRLYRAVSAAPSKSELVSNAREEILAMVVSGRNFFQPQLYNTILEKITNPADRTNIRLLALNHFSASHFVQARSDMMDMRRGLEFQPVYEHDFTTMREYSAQVTIEDPARDRFDVRFYSHMPTTYFYIVDGVLHLSFLLSKPIMSSPYIRVSPVDDESRAVISTFRSHFEHYWNSARFFITLIGITQNRETVLVKNRKRGLEWPTGYIEPNEDLAMGAAREFTEETGYQVGGPILLEKTPHGYFYVARVGARLGAISAREVSEVVFVPRLPERKSMSFSRDYSDFVDYFDRALNMYSQLPAPD
jgi:hypothetical protein